MTDWNQQRNSFAFLTVADVAAVALQAGQQAAEVGATLLARDLLLPIASSSCPQAQVRNVF